MLNYDAHSHALTWRADNRSAAISFNLYNNLTVTIQIAIHFVHRMRVTLRNRRARERAPAYTCSIISVQPRDTGRELKQKEVG